MPCLCSLREEQEREGVTWAGCQLLLCATFLPSTPGVFSERLGIRGNQANVEGGDAAALPWGRPSYIASVSQRRPIIS